MSIDTSEQFEKMKKIGSIVANCLAFLKAKTQPGMSTLELDEMAGKFLKDHGAFSAPKTVYDFPGFTCISLEKTTAHGIPSSTIIKEGDLLNIDVSAHLDGYYADNGESFLVGGKGDEFKKRLCKAAKKSLNMALKKAKAGGKISALGKEVEKVADSFGFTIIENLGGHGVGRSLHEKPEFIASFFDEDDRRVFKENCIVAVEPFISNGGTWIRKAKDGWGLYHPKFYSAQKEHTIMITKDKPYIFTNPTKSY